MTDTTMIDRLKQFVESDALLLNGYRRHYTTIRLQDVGRSSGYRRYCHCDGRGKKDDVRGYAI